MNRQDISIIILTYNRARLLEHVLPTYLMQPRVKEVIVVDDGSDDNTPQILQSWSQREPRLVILRLPVNSGLLCAVNAGIRRASGAYIFIGEDDVELTSDCFEILLKHMVEKKADIIAPRRIWLPPWEDKKAAKVRADTKQGAYLSPPMQLGDAEIGGEVDLDVPVLPGNFLARREVFYKISYDENFRGYPYRLETDFTLMAKEYGFKLIFCPHAVCYHIEFPSYVKGKRRLWMTLSKWFLINHYYFLRKHRERMGPLLGVKGSVGSLMLRFAASHLIAQIRSGLYCCIKKIKGTWVGK